ncbi:glutamine amidotransferase-related protein [Pseudomonas fontis]|nr:gamma-glutamyl-gamma-aminobutyrate hydrolase family protein [Pseudomonas fontis]MDD0974627.1 glutamine amidotransferase [Pseudomonas fontis]
MYFGKCHLLGRNVVMHLHFVVHEVFEGPGALLGWATSRGCSTGFSRVYAGDALPQSVDGIDLLIVLGGPQGPGTTLAQCAHFDGQAEMALIRRCIEAGKGVLGVCLGAQLIGEALGAPVERSPEKEIGSFPITFTDHGRRHDKFAHFGEQALVGHWHNDMPGLTPEAIVLASSEGCPRQIIEYSDRVYGFQCHMEFTPALVELLIAHSEHELRTLTAQRFVQQPERLRFNRYEEMNQQLFVFLDKLAATLQEG